MTRILLVDDHTIFREGLKRLFSEQGDFQVIAEARDGAEMLRRIRSDEFDVMLLDINMPGRSGLEMLPSIRAERPWLPVIVLSMYPMDQYALRAFQAGASGYVTKDMDARELIQAVRKVAAGGRYVTPEVAASVLDQLGGAGGSAPHLQLSPREYEIMLQIVRGTRLTEIGRSFFLSVKTVSTYRSRILRKLGVTSNAEVARYALLHRLID